ncbi:hypothetical protein EMPS_02105 [Entomortierella parvispora]|uniref:Endoplasmic oxidoreductin n=1 Tax=Entomortierella parvispora TaxID=205924 RepID=A0A9P3LTF2_9FUNG|nr:hypothetical protein EMPS_02105 [Entomortierella parvispora]
MHHLKWAQPSSRTLLPLLLLLLLDTLYTTAPVLTRAAASPSLSPPVNRPWANGLNFAHTNANRHLDDSQPRRKSKRVNIPFFVDHLVTQQRKHRESSTLSSKPSSLSADMNEPEHDHTLHKPGQCRQSMQIENSICDYDAVEKVNDEMRVQLRAIVQQKFFRYYKLNLYESCPFWSENHLCMNPDCGVALVDEQNIPQEWTSAALGALTSPKNGEHFQPFKSCNLKDQDFCEVDDEASSEGVYVDLIANPERFTGYAGPSAAKVWGAIYNENCFNVAQRMQMDSDCEQCSLDRESEAEELKEELQTSALTGFSMAQNPASIPLVPSEPAHAHDRQHNHHSKTKTTTSEDMSKAFDPVSPLAAGAAQDDEICLEKRVFYRMISGLHASISIHICDEYLNQSTGVWGPNLDCFVSRVGAHPDRLENIYFDYAILVRAVTKLSGYLQDYEFCTGNSEEDAGVKVMVDRLIETATRSPAIFDEKAMFVGPEAQALKMEFRDHFRNITKIVSCVGCEKCRLWGKVQTSGLGTALKVLFSYNDEHLNPIKNPNLLQRTEIVALFNTFNRVSESVESIARFRTLYMSTLGSSHTDHSNGGQSDDGMRSSILNHSMGGQSARSRQSDKKPTTRSHALPTEDPKKTDTDGQAKFPKTSKPSAVRPRNNSPHKQRGTETPERLKESGSLGGLASVREMILELSRQPLQLVWGNDDKIEAHDRYPHGERRPRTAAAAAAAAAPEASHARPNAK